MTSSGQRGGVGAGVIVLAAALPLFVALKVYMSMKVTAPEILCMCTLCYSKAVLLWLYLVITKAVNHH